jgi:phage regulator Rha-like protein
MERIARSILVLRGHKVMLDSDLAELYGVETKMLNRAVKRNLKRFPPDFMFQLNSQELHNLRFHFGTSKESPGGRRYLPYVFTEQGVAMLSSVLRSERAVQINVLIMRAFVKLRELLATNKDLSEKLAAIEQKYDEKFRIVFLAIEQLMKEDEQPRKPIGFDIESEK